MKATIDAAGRIVIPKSLRERLGLTAGGTLELREREGCIEIEPAATPMRLVSRKGGAVAVAGAPMPPLTDEIVRQAIERTRR